MTVIGTATVPPRVWGQGSTRRVRQWSGQVAFMGRRPLTLMRSGEQRKDTCAAAPANRRLGALKVSRSHFPIPAVRPEFPAPILGLMENPAVERRPFPVPCVGQMETFLK
jgi:hypothetical protein